MIDSSELAFFEINTQSEHIKMDKSLNRNVSEKLPKVVLQIVYLLYQDMNNIVGKNESVAKNESNINSEENSDDDDTIVITSPMVGTFYSDLISWQ